MGLLSLSRAGYDALNPPNSHLLGVGRARELEALPIRRIVTGQVSSGDGRLVANCRETLIAFDIRVVRQRKDEFAVVCFAIKISDACFAPASKKIPCRGFID